MGLAPGTRLSHYEIIGPIGSGGMGEVYKARDTRLDRTVAIKVIRADDSGDPTMRLRLLREARAASSLNHPHICTVHDVHDGDQPFIAMEWIEGESLAQKLGRSGAPVAVAELLRLAAQIADALDVAHTAGVVHRDLKPANLFVTRRGDAKILDFGLALTEPSLAGVSADQATIASARKLTGRGEAVGTVSYMAPEQARGERVDERSDLFSFGVVLYEMATGRSPFAAPTTALTFDAILNRQPPLSRTVNGEVPAVLDQIIHRLLSKDPSSRIQSARALRDELQAAQQSLQKKPSSGGRPVAPSIAVLPFTNLSPEPENEYIADGITEEIINTLAQLKGLQVAARTSSFSFKGKTPELSEVAAKLHVAHVLTGSVRKAGSRLRVTVQLVNADDQLTVWSERYDRQTDDIFQIQDEIAAAIAQKLRVSLTDPAGEPIARRGTESVEAYELCLKGRFFVNQRGAGILRGLECFEQARTLDPGYAVAHAAIGGAAALAGFYGYQPSYEAMPTARRAAQNAIELDPSLAEPHAVLQFVSFAHDWDWDHAEREFARAVALNDRLPITYQWRSLNLASHARYDEAAAVVERATELEPLSAFSHAARAWVFAYSGNVDETELAARRAQQLDPQVWIAGYMLATAFTAAGRHEDALAEAERVIDVSQRHGFLLTLLTELHMRAGRRGKAVDLVEEVIDRARTHYMSPLWLAMTLASVDRVEEAVSHWERAYRERDVLPIWNNWPVVPAAFARDPRFREILRRAGLKLGRNFAQ